MKDILDTLLFFFGGVFSVLGFFLILIVIGIPIFQAYRGITEIVNGRMRKSEWVYYFIPYYGVIHFLVKKWKNLDD